MVGIEMVKTFATSKTSLRRKEVASTTHLLLQSSSSTTMTKYSCLIATHTHILTALSFFKSFALLIVRIGFAKQLFARLWLEMIAKWLSSQISAHVLRKLRFEEPL